MKAAHRKASQQSRRWQKDGEDFADARVVEATRTDLKKLYSDIEISVNNKEFAYI